MQQAFAKRGEPKVNFFAPKLPDLAEQTDATKGCYRRGIVTKYLETVDGGLGAEPLPLGEFCNFAGKK